MSTLPIYQVDAFTDKVFQGNPAAVVPLYSWLDDRTLLNIAAENNLSETAFFILGADKIELRWFTPAAEVDLCGHATMAAAHVLFEELNFPESNLIFTTKSGELSVAKTDAGYAMDFPATQPVPCEDNRTLISGLNQEVVAMSAGYDYLIELKDEESVRGCQPNLSLWKQLDKRGVIITAKGNDYDIVSRCFYPKLLVDEDPVTGSAHCQIAPYWASKLNRSKLTAFQASHRGGVVECSVRNDRVNLIGNAITYLKGEILIS
ncbi:MAG: PhzF family phenazine biosynthesis protein [Gammaproteobacteria bacterium]|nr:PhzF family phenazine biosynthesis protein [Gammaproteobacteria bacterium]